MYTLEERFYIPLVDLKVNIKRLKREVDRIINPKKGDYALTCQEQDQGLDVYDFKKYAGQRVFNPNSKFMLSTGEMDNDIVYWPKCLQGSYIQKVERLISSYLGLERPRCRLSIRDDPLFASNIGFHNDNHTPYRVHIALETTPKCMWLYREGPDMPEYALHQPVSPHPVLIETSEIQHDVFVPPFNKRLHLWYQYHKGPDPELVEALIEKARA